MRGATAVSKYPPSFSVSVADKGLKLTVGRRLCGAQSQLVETVRQAATHLRRGMACRARLRGHSGSPCRAQFTAPLRPRLPILPGATTVSRPLRSPTLRVSLTPLSATLTKNAGVLFES
jgi:hypothetical protein